MEVSEDLSTRGASLFYLLFGGGFMLGGIGMAVAAVLDPEEGIGSAAFAFLVFGGPGCHLVDRKSHAVPSRCEAEQTSLERLAASFDATKTRSHRLETSFTLVQ
jgi:hypothetical protein